MREPVVLRLIRSAARTWWDDDCTRLGASIAYYTLFAIAPVLLVATAIAGMVFGAEAVSVEIVRQLDHLVGREGALAVESLSTAPADVAPELLPPWLGASDSSWPRQEPFSSCRWR